MRETMRTPARNTPPAMVGIVILLIAPLRRTWREQRG